MDGARPVRSPRGTTLTARQWSTEAPMRMLMNNLDPENAERPDDLVVYGGTGRAARDWKSFDAFASASSERVATYQLAEVSRTASNNDGEGAAPVSTRKGRNLASAIKSDVSRSWLAMIRAVVGVVVEGRNTSKPAS